MRLSKGVLAAIFVFVSIMILGSISWAGVNDDLFKAADNGDLKTAKT